MIYLTSDLHLCHDKEFIYKERGFNTVDEHNNIIIDNILKTCSADDKLYILGDLMLNDNVKAMQLLQKLSHIEKYIIIGNHDTDARIQIYNQLENTTVLGYGYRLKYKKFNFYLSHYPTLTGNFDDSFTLSRKVINLCGHTHTTDRFSDTKYGLIYHVEVDAHNLCPVSIEDIITDIYKFNK